MLDEEKKKTINLAKKSKIARGIFQGVLYTWLVLRYTLTPQGLEDLSDPRKRAFLFNRKLRVGLLEGSMIQNPLWVPSKENEGDISYKKAMVGKWVSYDFNRKKKLGKKVEQLKKGKLFTFPLDDILDNDVEDFTPTGYLDLFDVRHLLYIDTSPIGEVEEIGFVRETSYGDVFRRVGQYESYAKQLDREGLTNLKVYQVTPKGNGLVFILEEGGEKRKKPQQDFTPVLEPKHVRIS